MTTVNRHLEYPSGKRQAETHAHLGGGELAKLALMFVRMIFVGLVEKRTNSE